MKMLVRGFVALLVIAVTARAQPALEDWNNVKALGAGPQVRIKMGKRTIRGYIQGASDDTVTVNTEAGKEMIARQSVTDIAVRKAGHRGRNALFGAGIGAAFGVLSASTTYSPCTNCFTPGPSKGAVIAAGAVVFGGIGAAIGALIPSGGWRGVYRR